MANLKEIKRKIKSVQNTQKTTRAMKLVSTAKLRKAEEVAKQSRIYADKINEVLSEIAYKINQYKVGGVKNRYFESGKTPSKVDLIFVTADKGLCGGFNIQTIKAVKGLLDEYKAKKVGVRLRAIGKKGIEFFNFQDIELLKEFKSVSSAPTYKKAQDIIAEAIEDFESGATDEIVLIHNGYLNMISQELKINNLVPIDPIKYEGKQKESLKSMMVLEPEDDDKILVELLKKYFEYNMYYALIDSLAAEHSARMQAMDNATNNAKERVESLNIAYNKARQESITTELIEIISGVESMK